MSTVSHRYPPMQFALFRVLFGGLLCVEFARYIPYAGELFGPNGPCPTHLAGPLPNPFVFAQDAWTLQALFSFAALLAACVAAGLLRRTCSMLLAFVWLSLLARTVYVTIPSDGYIGWFLVALVVIPNGEPFALSRHRGHAWDLPPGLFAAAWVVIACSYTASGIDKLSSPSWRFGDALTYVFLSPISRGGWVADLPTIVPDAVLAAGTYLALGLEILHIPLALRDGTRKYLWAATMLMHLCILVTLDIPAVSVTMLVIHLFLYDNRWGFHRALLRRKQSTPSQHSDPTPA